MSTTGEEYSLPKVEQGGKVEVLDENGTVLESYATKGSFNELELLSPIYYYPVCPAAPEIM